MRLAKHNLYTGFLGASLQIARQNPNAVVLSIMNAVCNSA